MRIGAKRASEWCAAVVLVYLLVACATVPVTGRRSLQLLPESQLMALSLQQYSDVLKKSKLSTDRAKVKAVQRVGWRIAQAAEEFMRDAGRGAEVENYEWEFTLIEDDKQVNAWAMPGGKVAVYTGILPVTRDDTGLAVVLGHEVGHVLARHGNERMSQGLLAQMGQIGLAVALSTRPAETQALFMTAYGMGAQVGLLLPYSRLHEAEADYIGLILMAKAGYDPREAPAFWERMTSQGGGSRPPEFLSTHPAPESRIANIKAQIPEAMRYYTPRS
jgi:predicted Zn-dependent protease